MPSGPMDRFGNAPNPDLQAFFVFWLSEVARPFNGNGRGVEAHQYFCHTCPNPE